MRYIGTLESIRITNAPRSRILARFLPASPRCRRSDNRALRRPNDLEFLADVSHRLAAARQLQGLADPFGQGHVPRPRHALNFPVFGILKNDLQSFSHTMSLAH